MEIKIISALLALVFVRETLFGVGVGAWLKSTAASLVALAAALFAQDQAISLLMSTILVCDWGVSVARREGTFLKVSARSLKKALAYAVAFVIVSGMSHAFTVFSFLYVPMAAYCVAREGGSVLLRLGEASAAVEWWRRTSSHIDETILDYLSTDKDPRGDESQDG